MDPTQRKQAVARLAKQRADQLRQLGPFGRPCAGCQHHVLANNMCAHPLYLQHSPDPVHGTLSADNPIETTVARSVSGLCGPEALLWEKSNKLRAWDYALGAGLLWVVGSSLAQFAVDMLQGR